MSTKTPAALLDLWTGIIIIAVFTVLGALVSINNGGGSGNGFVAPFLVGVGLLVGGTFIVHAQRKARRQRVAALASAPDPRTRLG